MLQLEHPCHYRINGLHCQDGVLADCMHIVQMMGPNEPVMCPACTGTNSLTTSEGRQLLAFVKKHLKPIVEELVQEAMR